MCQSCVPLQFGEAVKSALESVGVRFSDVPGLQDISSNCNQAGSEYDGADASTSSESCDHEDSTDCNGSHSLTF